MAEFTHYIYICVYTHHIWRPQGGSSHGAGPWATVFVVKTIKKKFCSISLIGVAIRCKNTTTKNNPHVEPTRDEKSAI